MTSYRLQIIISDRVKRITWGKKKEFHNASTWCSVTELTVWFLWCISLAEKLLACRELELTASKQLITSLFSYVFTLKMDLYRVQWKVHGQRCSQSNTTHERSLKCNVTTQTHISFTQYDYHAEWLVAMILQILAVSNWRLRYHMRTIMCFFSPFFSLVTESTCHSVSSQKGVHTMIVMMERASV